MQTSGCPIILIGISESDSGILCVADSNITHISESTDESAGDDEPGADVEVEWTAWDQAFFAAVQKFREEGCGCNIMSGMCPQPYSN